MAIQDATYRCNVCGQIVKVKVSGDGTLVCCDEPMKQVKENK